MAAQFSEFALLEVWVLLIEKRGGDETECGIPQEFKALIVLIHVIVFVAERGVGEGPLQTLLTSESIANGSFKRTM